MAVEGAKALLVATREYLENVRTRGFWVSILMMPFILIVVSIAPMLLSDAEGEARYAVIDQSGWVERAVAARIVHDDVGNTRRNARAHGRPTSARRGWPIWALIDTAEARARLVDETVAFAGEARSGGTRDRYGDHAGRAHRRVVECGSGQGREDSRRTFRPRNIATSQRPGIDKTALNRCSQTTNCSVTSKYPTTRSPTVAAPST